MVRDYSRRQFIVGCGCAGAGALAAGGAAAATGDRRAAQPATRWNRTYESNGNAEMNAVVSAVDDDGFVLAGATGELDEEQAADSDRGAWLAKIDAAGNVVWEETYTRQSTTVASDLLATDGGYLLVGRTSGGPDGGQDAFAISVDAEGGVDWEKTFWNTPDSDDAVNAVVSRRDGGFVCAGKTSRFDRAWLVHLSDDGNVRNNGTISGGSEGSFNDIARHPDGGYLVVGSGDDNTGDLQGWVTRVNESFEQVWATGQFFRKSSDSGTNPYDDFNAFYGVTRDNAGFTMVGANAFDPDDAEREGWILQINKNGDKQWDNRFAADRFNEFHSVLWDTNRLEYRVVGQTAANADGVDRRGYALNVGLTGERNWQGTFAGEESEASHFNDVYLTSENGTVCVGGTAPSVGANPNGWSVKIGGEEVPTPTPSPSPTPSATPSGGGGTTTTESTPTLTATATSTPGGGGDDGTDEPTATEDQSESGLPVTMIGVGLAIVALGAGGFLYNRFARGDGDGDEPVAGPGAGTGGAATLTGGAVSGEDSAAESDDEPGADSEPTPASEVVGDEELERAQTVVDKPESGADEAAGDAGEAAEESGDTAGVVGVSDAGEGAEEPNVDDSSGDGETAADSDAGEHAEAVDDGDAAGDSDAPDDAAGAEDGDTPDDGDTSVDGDVPGDGDAADDAGDDGEGFTEESDSESGSDTDDE